MTRLNRAARACLVMGLLALAADCAPLRPAGGARVGTAAPGNMSAVLSAHNRYRAQHCVAPLAWSNALARTAQAWAERCSFTHSGNRLGENLAWGSAGAFSPTRFVDNWYGEVASYDFGRGRGRDGRQTGHFTQIVWAGSRQVGCGWARCGRQDNLVCNYSPPGNYVRRHGRNVRPRC